MFLQGIFNKGLDDSQFEGWLDKALSVTLPDGIEAFCFNIYEDGGNTFSIELIGTGSFDKGNSDWACDEVFTNRNAVGVGFVDGELVIIDKE